MYSIFLKVYAKVILWSLYPDWKIYEARLALRMISLNKWCLCSGRCSSRTINRNLKVPQYSLFQCLITIMWLFLTRNINIFCYQTRRRSNKTSQSQTRNKSVLTGGCKQRATHALRLFRFLKMHWGFYFFEFFLCVINHTHGCYTLVLDET